MEQDAYQAPRRGQGQQSQSAVPQETAQTKNLEYLEMLQEKNRMKRESERTREKLEQDRIKGREAGFNVYVSGANEQRVKAQQARVGMQGNSSQEKGVRRQWRDPSKEQPGQYQNPFQMGVFDPPSSTKHATNPGGHSPPKVRKKWGSKQADYSKNITNLLEDEDDYEEDFEHQGEEDDEIQRFLQEPTSEELDFLKQSIRDFSEFTKQFTQEKGNPEVIDEQDDEYIEEEFEHEEDSEGEAELKPAEPAYQTHKAQVETSQVVQSTTTNKRTRPISATYSLGVKKEQQSSQALSQAPSKDVLAAIKAENQKIAASKAQPTSNDSSFKNPFQKPFLARPVSNVVNSRQELLKEEKKEELPVVVEKVEPKQDSPLNQTQSKGLGFLLQRIERLDDFKRGQLLAVLRELESGANLSQVDLGFLSSAMGGRKAPEEKKAEIVEQKPKTEVRKPNQKEVKIVILSTWSSPHMCGLTQIELFDDQAKSINITQNSIFQRNQGTGPQRSLDKLINGKKLTNDEKQMWLGYLPSPGSPSLEILMYLSINQDIGGMKIWNYNKNILHCGNGVRDCRIEVDGEKVWEGEILKATGRTDFDYATPIVLKQGLDLPLEIQPPQLNSASFSGKIEDSQSHTESPGKVREPTQTPRTQLPPASDQMKERKQTAKEQKEDFTPFWLRGSDQQKKPEKKGSENKLQKAREEKKQLGRQRGETENQKAMQAVQDAVDRVKQVVGADLNQPDKLDGSLESLDFFKVTNLGRLNQNKPQDSAPKRKGWNKSNKKERPQEGTTTIGSQGSQGKKEKHPQVKSPFPFQDDILDQFTKKEEQKKAPVFQEQFPKKIVQDVMPGEPAQPQVQPEELSFEQRLDLFDQPFLMPSLPRGQRLSVSILNTWGDQYYVGLAGIELFDEDGNPIRFHSPEQQVRACPPDINILPGQGNDPRTADKLVDGSYFTQDDLHAWMAPFTLGQDHRIDMELDRPYALSMIRIWNYNKSRIHSFRGARLVEILLDEVPVFRGEVRRAAGNLNDPENCCEILVFTQDIGTLEQIDASDWLNDTTPTADTTQTMIAPPQDEREERPLTSTKKFSSQEVQDIQQHLRQGSMPTSMFDERPQTSAGRPAFQSVQALEAVQMSTQEPASSQVASGRMLTLLIEETWGDLFYVGLNGLELLDENMQLIPVFKRQLSACPRDMNDLQGHNQDQRVLENLIDGVNNTREDRHIWLIPFNQGEQHVVTIDLGSNRKIGAIKFYNYNKSEEDTLRGAKRVVIKLDGKLLTPRKGVSLRKAFGFVNALVDSGQTVRLPFKDAWSNEQIVPFQRQAKLQQGVFQEYDVSPLPICFTLTLNLYSTHGDFYYIGLNGLEILDQNGKDVIQTRRGAFKVFAEPHSVQILEGMEGDTRVPHNLCLQPHATADENKVWLAPFKNTKTVGKDKQNSRVPNFVMITFEHPISISALRLFNYTKTPSRGVKEFEVLLDQKPVYRGYCRKVMDQNQMRQAFDKDDSTVVLFSNEDETVRKWAQKVEFDPAKTQEVVLVHDRKVLSKGAQKRQRTQEFVPFDESARPTTKVAPK